ncbi:hypothetical protein MKA48_05255 [[Clostridium] innocuum]|nr:hypothetical protein [[Clostridium] innocuum]
MEMDILIKAEERLLNVLERLAKAWETSLHTQEPTTRTTATVTTETPKMPETPETPKTTKHLHYGLQADGVSTYTKWDDMCKALDHARETQGPAKVKEVLTTYSDNGEYGGVQPAKWDKVIKECYAAKAKTEQAPEPKVEAEPEQVADISEEELRTACTMAKNAGVNVPHYLESIAGVKRVTKVPEGLRIKVKEALEAEMGGVA